MASLLERMKTYNILSHPLFAYIERIIKLVYKEFKEDQCTREANAMAYRTLFSAVPLLAVFLTIFTAFGAFSGFKYRVIDFMSSYLVPSAKDVIMQHLMQMADNTKTLSGIGLAFLILVALYLFNTIELAFNRIWNVSDKRPFIRKFTAFTAILLWSPVFFGLSFYLTGVIQAHLPWLNATTDVGLMNHLILRSLPIFFTWAALTIIFTVVPNTRVEPRAAAAGALVASLGWEFVKIAFNYYVVNAVAYSKVYGSLSVIPIFIVGVYLLWAVVFLGAELTYVLHNYRYHEEWSEQDWTGYKPYLAVGVMIEVGNSFHKGEKPLSVEVLAQRFRVAIPVLKLVLSSLVQAGLLHKTENDTYSPARDLHLITLEQILDSSVEKVALIRQMSRSSQYVTQRMSPENAKMLSNIFGSLEKEHHNAMGSITLEQLVKAPPESAPIHA